MVTGTLTPRTVRDTYLRGFDLGAAWEGPGGDMAIATLLDAQVAHAEALMGIHWRRWRIATYPDATAVAGTDYDQLGNLIPYTAPLPDQQYHSLILRYHDVQAVTRVRLFEGYDGALPPAPVFETLPLESLLFQSYDEALYVPIALVQQPGLAQAWAVDYEIGIGTLPAEITEWCALGAAIEVLSMAGAATDVTHGLSGEMLRQDGIEERAEYGSGSQWQGGGLYAGPITILRNRREDIDIVKLRFRYQNTLGDRSTVPSGAVIPRLPYETRVALPPPVV
jgi:hypothetical protein